MHKLDAVNGMWNHTATEFKAISTNDIWIQNTTTSNDTLLVKLSLDGRIGNLKLGYTYCVIAGVTDVMAIYSTKKILSDVNPFVTTFWIAVSGITFSLIEMAIVETPMLPSGKVCLSLLIGHAVAAGRVSRFGQ